MKFVITEEEKKRILSLYEQGWVGQKNPNDYQIVDKKNPYKHNHLKSAQKRYSTFFQGPQIASKNGDLYYVFDFDNVDKYLYDYAQNFYDNLLLGKTVRGEDGKVYTIKKIQPKIYSESLIDWGRIHVILYLIYQDGSGSRIVIDDSGAKNMKVSDAANKIRRDIATKTNTEYKPEPYNNHVDVGEKLLKFLLDNKPLIKREEIPDDFFEIRKINLQQTDFKP